MTTRWAQRCAWFMVLVLALTGCGGAQPNGDATPSDPTVVESAVAAETPEAVSTLTPYSEASARRQAKYDRASQAFREYLDFAFAMEASGNYIIDEGRAAELMVEPQLSKFREQMAQFAAEGRVDPEAPQRDMRAVGYENPYSPDDIFLVVCVGDSAIVRTPLLPGKVVMGKIQAGGVRLVDDGTRIRVASYDAQEIDTCPLYTGDEPWVEKERAASSPGPSTTPR